MSPPTRSVCFTPTAARSASISPAVDAVMPAFVIRTYVLQRPLATKRLTLGTSPVMSEWKRLPRDLNLHCTTKCPERASPPRGLQSPSKARSRPASLVGANDITVWPRTTPRMVPHRSWNAFQPREASAKTGADVPPRSVPLPASAPTGDSASRDCGLAVRAGRNARPVICPRRPTDGSSIRCSGPVGARHPPPAIVTRGRAIRRDSRSMVERRREAVCARSLRPWLTLLDFDLPDRRPVSGTRCRGVLRGKHTTSGAFSH